MLALKATDVKNRFAQYVYRQGQEKDAPCKSSCMGASLADGRSRD